MTIAIFLYMYYIFLGIWMLIALIALYHILSYGVKGVMTLFTTVVFVGVAGLILSSSFFYIKQFDWTMPIMFLDNIDFDNTNNF